MGIYRPSEYLNSIFCSDIFVISGGGTLLMGYGKTKTGQISTSEAMDSSISQSYSRLFSRDGKLWGHWEMPIGGAHEKREVEITSVVYCVDKPMTEIMFTEEMLKIISKDEFLKLARFDITMCPDSNPAFSTLKQELDSESYFQYSQPALRIERLKNILNESNIENYGALPWAVDVSTRARVLLQGSKLWKNGKTIFDPVHDKADLLKSMY